MSNYTADQHPTTKETPMLDQTTDIRPDLRLGEDEYGDLVVTHDGEEVASPPIYGMDPDAGTEAVFRILTSMSYVRKDYFDGTVGYWCYVNDGAEFWASADTLRELIDRMAGLVSMYLTGRNGYPLFDTIRNLNGVK